MFCTAVALGCVLEETVADGVKLEVAEFFLLEEFALRCRDEALDQRRLLRNVDPLVVERLLHVQLHRLQPVPPRQFLLSFILLLLPQH